MADAAQQQGVLHVGFNQTFCCFACGTKNGFRVYNCDPFTETRCRGSANVGISIVEMLFRCNILALVGDGSDPKYPRNTVMIWDDHQGKCIGELSFRSQVRAVRLRRDRIVVALEHKVLVYNFADLQLLHQIETLANPQGLVAISSAAESTVLTCPGLHPGQVRIELYDRRQTKFVSAHNNSLCSMVLSLCGKRLATASEKGTLVRVWNTADGQLLQELRRGADPAVIYSLALSRDCDWLAVSSAKGTVHVFALSEAVATAAPDEARAAAAGGAATGNGNGEVAAAPGRQSSGGAPARSNPTSLLSMVKGFVPSVAVPKYFNSEWSFAQFRIQDDNSRSVVGFAQQPNAPTNTLMVLTHAGSFYKVTFDPVKGGPCTQEAYVRFSAPEPL